MVAVDLPEHLLSRYYTSVWSLRDPHRPIVLCDEINLWMARHEIRGWLGMEFGQVRTMLDDGRRSTTYTIRFYVEFENDQQAMLFKLTWL